MKMDSQKFIQTLENIGYPNVHKICPEGIDWAFENPAMRPFLNWFSTSVRDDNVVSSQEMLEYKHMEESGVILEKQQLDEALESTKQGSGLDSEDLESEVERLKLAVKKAKEKKMTLKAHHNKLSAQQIKLTNKDLKMREIEQQTKKAMATATDSCSMQNTKMNEALQQLTASVSRLSDLYADDSGCVRSKKDAKFLSQLDLSAFHDAEAKYSHDLTAFTKRQFFEGVSQMSGGGSSTEYTLLDLKSPQKGTVADPDKEQAFLDDCDQMQWLQQVFPKSECDRINALLNAKRAHGAVHEAVALLERLKSGHFPTSTTEISHFQKGIETNIEQAVNEAQPLLSSLPDLLRELGDLQGGEILTGDYDLKLRRQEYFTHKQEQVISHLVSQRARAEFLSLLYELELRCHRETHVLLGAIRQVLAAHHKAWSDRMEELEDPDLSEKRFQGRVVDARDTSTQGLFHLLGDSETDKSLLCVQKHKVVEKAKHLHAQHTCAKAADQTADDKYCNKLSQFENCLSECEKHLYAGSSTSGGQPMLTPPDIQEKFTSLNSSLAALEKDVAVIISDVDKKKMALKANPLQYKERDNFVLFHTNPERLENVVNEQAQRSRVQSIK